jgi:hypothetical protein
MKNEKFCFSKGTGLIALVGIVLVAAAILMSSLSGQSTSTSTRANTLTSCDSGYSIWNTATKKHERGSVAVDACERFAYGTTNYNTGKKCIFVIGAAYANLKVNLVACPIPCIYGDKVLGEGSSNGFETFITPPPSKPTGKGAATTYYLGNYLGKNENGSVIPGRSCIMERRDDEEGFSGIFTGKVCDFNSHVYNTVGGRAKVVSDRGCNQKGSQMTDVQTGYLKLTPILEPFIIDSNGMYIMDFSANAVVEVISIDKQSTKMEVLYPLSWQVTFKKAVTRGAVANRNNDFTFSGINTSLKTHLYERALNKWHKTYPIYLKGVLVGYRGEAENDTYKACVGYRNIGDSIAAAPANKQASCANGKVAYGVTDSNSELKCGCVYYQSWDKNLKKRTSYKYPTLDYADLSL